MRVLFTFLDFALSRTSYIFFTKLFALIVLYSLLDSNNTQMQILSRHFFGLWQELEVLAPLNNPYKTRRPSRQNKVIN